MITDTVEAATRAIGVDPDRDKFAAQVTRFVREKRDQGQFDECPITLKDLDIITETLIRVLPTADHKRIKYVK